MHEKKRKPTRARYIVPLQGSQKAVKKFAGEFIFLLHAGADLVSCECELTIPGARVSIA